MREHGESPESFRDFSTEDMVLEPLQQGIRLLLNCFLVSLGCVSVSVDDEAFLGNIMELLNLKLRQSWDGLLNSISEIQNLYPFLRSLYKWRLCNLLLGPSCHVLPETAFPLQGPRPWKRWMWKVLPVWSCWQCLHWHQAWWWWSARPRRHHTCHQRSSWSCPAFQTSFLDDLQEHVLLLESLWRH